jgi:hypothetical protein
MTLHNTYLALQSVLGHQIEPFDSIALVEEYRRYFKPAQVKVLLLAESHVFTSDEDTNIIISPIPGLINYPTRYAKFVYCLAYGERSLTKSTNHPKRDGTPQFWKIFYSCTNKVQHKDDFSPILGRTPEKERIKNKINVLISLKENGIWLVDTSIAALYKNGKKLNNMQKALSVSWQSYTKEVVLNANPQHVICIGKGVAREVEKDLEKNFQGRYSVVAQPNAFLSSEEHMKNYMYYSRVCCG